MGMTTYMLDRTGRFDPHDEALGAAHLVTVQLHWRLINAPAGVMPRDTKHEPKCASCRKKIRDVYFWYVDKRAYCRECGDEEVVPHCRCGCKRADCPVCQAMAVRGKISKPRKKAPKRRKKTGPPPRRASATFSLSERLVELLERRKLELEKARANVTVNPLTGQPGFAPPDPYPKGATDEELAAFTSRTGIELPDDVKEWLGISNGPPGFFGIGTAQKGSDMEELLQVAAGLRKKGWIPVGRDDFGNYYVRVVPKSGGGGVFYVEATDTDELVYAVASDALHFALFDLEHQMALSARKTYGWPQDRSFVLSEDPKLADVEGARFLWDS